MATDKKIDPLQLALKALRNRQPDGPKGKNNNGGVTSFGSIRPDGSNLDWENRACCAALNYSNSGHEKAQAFYIWQEAKRGPETDAWIAWIIGPQSPWIELVKAQPEQDVEQVCNYGYIMTNLKFPSNYVVTFLMHFRLALEFPSRCSWWYKAVQAGANPSIAAYLAECVTEHKDKGQIVGTSYHTGFMTGYSGVSTIKNILNQQYVKSAASPHTFYDNTAYTPCHKVWGYSGEDNLSKGIYATLVSFAKDKETKGKRVETRFASPREDRRWSSVHMIKLEDYVEFCQLAEQDKL